MFPAKLFLQVVCRKPMISFPEEESFFIELYLMLSCKIYLILNMSGIKFLLIIFFFIQFFSCQNNDKPNIVLIMTDDQGWAQTGYYDHPVLKTPNLDAMAENGLRFDRFYAGAPQCSPTRASVLTGRNNDRTGVFYHGYALNKNEITISKQLKNMGYSTGHFGKWHLNGIRGPGVPIFKDDEFSPTAFGFDEWISVTNFFDINPIMSDNGKFTDFYGSSSKIIVTKALEFIEKNVNENKPFYCDMGWITS